MFAKFIEQKVRNPIATKSTEKEVTIEIDEHDKHDSYAQIINVEQYLSEFRIKLLALYEQNPIGRIRLYENMLFVGLRGGLISKYDENHRKLGDILHDRNIIKIKRSHDYLEYIDESEIIKRCKLEYGIKMSDDGPVEPYKNKKAFEFIRQNDVVELFQPIADIYNKDEHITRNNNYEITYQKNLIANLNVSTNLPWTSLSADFKISYKKSKGRTNYNENSMTFDVKLQGRAKVIMTNKVRPSKEFKKAVDDALSCSNPVEKLKKLKNVCNEYGEFWAREVILGGKIQTVRDDFVEINTQTTETMKGGGVGVNVENVDITLQCNKTESEKIGTNNKESITKSMYIGGDTKMAHKNVDEWVKSLDDYTTWRIVEYRDVVSIFEILEGDLRRRVLDTLGKNILYAQIDQQNLKDYQIFATIISEKQKGTFSVRVIYTTDSNTANLHSANLLIHQFRKSGKNHKVREYSLKIGWTIIGIPNDFNLFDFEDFNGLKELEVELSKDFFNGLKELEVKLSKDFSSNRLHNVHDIYDKYEKCKTYPLVTCALRNSESLQYNLLDLEIVTGIHFHHTPLDKHLRMCVHNHNLENENLSGLDLLVQYCITQRARNPVPEGKLCDDNRFFNIRGNKTRWTCD
ncbi:31071_t:CDS:2, partial [Racocetra persica]